MPPSSGPKVCQASNEQEAKRKTLAASFVSIFLVKISLFLNTETFHSSETSTKFYRTKVKVNLFLCLTN
jgi:hypothetical protein